MRPEKCSCLLKGGRTQCLFITSKVTDFFSNINFLYPKMQWMVLTPMCTRNSPHVDFLLQIIRVAMQHWELRRKNREDTFVLAVLNYHWNISHPCHIYYFIPYSNKIAYKILCCRKNLSFATIIILSYISSYICNFAGILTFNLANIGRNDIIYKTLCQSPEKMKMSMSVPGYLAV